MLLAAAVMPRVVGAIKIGLTAIVTSVQTAAALIAGSIDVATAGITLIIQAVILAGTVLAGLAIGTETGRGALAKLGEIGQKIFDMFERGWNVIADAIGPIMDGFGELPALFEPLLKSSRRSTVPSVALLAIGLMPLKVAIAFIAGLLRPFFGDLGDMVKDLASWLSQVADLFESRVTVAIKITENAIKSFLNYMARGLREMREAVLLLNGVIPGSDAIAEALRAAQLFWSASRST